MSNKRAIIDAANAGDFRRVISLAQEELVDPVSREFNDIVGGIRSILASHGVQSPANWVRLRRETQTAAIGLDSFLTAHSARVTSKNRLAVISMVGNHAVAAAEYIPVGMSEAEAAARRKTPLHVRMLQILASSARMRAVFNEQFPGYLDSDLLSMVGLDMVKNKL